MAFPSKLLDEGEEVVADIRPHWSFLARPVTLTVAAVAGAIAGLAWSVPAWAQWGLLVLIGLALVGLAVRYTGWTATNLVVTTDRLVSRRGVLRRHTREIPIERVTDLSVEQTLAERILGCGRLLIESTGERGQEVVPRVGRPSEVQRLIRAQVRRSRSVPGGAGLGPSWPSIPEQIEKLDELCRRGIISRDELDRKRAQLLDRW